LKRALGIVVALGLLGVIGWGVWRLFPPPEKVIRERIARIGGLVSLQPNESTLARVAKVEQIAGLLAPDLTVSLEGAAGELGHSASRDSFLEALRAARLQARQLTVRVLEVNFESPPANDQAVTKMIVAADVNGEANSVVQELRVTWRRVERAWLVAGIETVKNSAFNR
jgi:hypothetical protein